MVGALRGRGVAASFPLPLLRPLPVAGNGTIDPLELRTCLSALGALLTDTDVEEMFEASDGRSSGPLRSR